MRDHKPEEIIRLAVHGMMPKNKVREFLCSTVLYIYI